MKIPDPKREIAELKAENKKLKALLKTLFDFCNSPEDHSARRQTAGSKSTQETAKRQHSASEMNSPI